jgi:hypothetical protein
MHLPEAEWIAYDLFYHEDRDHALRHFVGPAFGSVWREGRIDNFFFVRYALGGPHLRLRAHVCLGPGTEVGAILEDAAARFLAQHPSKATWSDEKIARMNRAVLANDRQEVDCGVPLDNTFLLAPLRFEVERYGGLGMIGASLDFFAVSSSHALGFLLQHAETPPARRLSMMFRILARQACGFATDGDDLLNLLSYPARFGDSLVPLSSHGDEVFDARRETFQALLAAECDALLHHPSLETEAARHLRSAIEGADAVTRRRIAESQMHMTANRLGLLNSEEVYLGRLLWRSARDLAEWAPKLWLQLCDFLASPSGTCGDSSGLGDLRKLALARGFGSFPCNPSGVTL